MRKFKRLYVEITNVCNLSCSFCPVTKREGEFIQVDKFKEILEKIKGYTDHLYFHIKGEPLLHPDIDSLLDVSSSFGYKVNLTTNGTLIKEVKEKIITKHALRQINFSLHSFDGNVGAGDKDEYVKNIIAFAKEAVEESSMIIALRLWNLEMNNLRNLENQKNRRILEIIEEEFKLDYKIEERIGSERGIRLTDRIYLNQDHEFEWPDLNRRTESIKGFCHGLRDQIGILVDGTVVPCCLDGEGAVRLGNVYETSFHDIVNGERAQKIFDGFSRKEAVEELCRKCGYRERFGR